jgi:trehalose 6-phosphate synthase
MQNLALACDFDGTLAHDGAVDQATLAALRRYAASGRTLVLITGRELEDLRQVFPHLALFRLVVAENGGLLYWPRSGEVITLAEPPPPALAAALRARGAQPLSVGRVVVATREPYDRAVRELIDQLGLDLEVSFNKGAVMVLPRGIDKGSGFRAALRKLGLPARQTVGVGDAENDLPFLLQCGRSVAVANALQEVKQTVQLVTRGARGAGVVELIEQLLDQPGPPRDDASRPAGGRPGRHAADPAGQRADGPDGLDQAPKIAIVANRGPRDFVWREGRWVTRNAAGGLVSMLTPLARRPDVAWFCCVSEPPAAHHDRESLFTTAQDVRRPSLHVVPVPLPAHVYRDYYGRISNEVLWMLQHHVFGVGGYEYLDHERHRAWQEGYLEANRRLAAVVSRYCATVEALLIQDYHLYPLPALLRRSFPDLPMLHFTHIPFPDVAVLKLVPRAWRETILSGLLGANVVGLQTPRDVDAFLACCAEFLPARVDREQSVVEQDGRRVAVRAYPASVDPGALRRGMRTSAVARARERLRPRMEPATIIRVDRVDPSKNQLIGFMAFERLLELRPDLRGRARFLAFLVPSRTDLDIYRAYRDAIYRKVAEVNRRFGQADRPPPIEIVYTNDRDQALAAMELADVLLVNSLEDGMNLVAKEWAVVSRRPGVLIVSETAGVVAEAADSALLVSPLDVEGTAQALAKALDMPAEARADRLARFRARVSQWSAADWLSAQLRDLGQAEASRPARSRGQASAVSAAPDPRGAVHSPHA